MIGRENGHKQMGIILLKDVKWRQSLINVVSQNQYTNIVQVDRRRRQRVCELGYTSHCIGHMLTHGTSENTSQ